MHNDRARVQLNVVWMSGIVVAVGALLASTAGQTQVRQTQAPQVTVRELATLEGDVNRYVVGLPNGRALIYAAFTDGATMNSPRGEDSTFTYNVVTKRRTLLGTNMLPDCVSPPGSQLVFSRSSEGGMGVFLWTMPIDPETGVATGEARRLSRSATGGGRAVFSPDGKMLAFNSPRSDGTFDLTLVPAAGGAERVVANVARGGAPAWSADGQSLYVQSDSSTTAIERVAVAGGRREPLVPRTRITNGARIGLSPDARVAFFAQNPDRFFYWAAWGIEGEISVDLPPPIDWGSGQNFGLESMRYLWMTQVFDQRVRILDLTTGRVRDLLPANVSSSTPAWSPDGRRLAVLSGSRLQYDITIVNSDGSSPRRYMVPMHLDTSYAPSPNPDGLVWEMPWSHDGRFLAFRAKAEHADGRKVAPSPDDQYQLALLDVNSGQTRVLTTSSAAIGRFVWRLDGNAIRALERTIAAGSPARWSIVEIPLSGPKRMLRDISAEFPNVNDLVFISERMVVVRAASDQSIQRFVVPLDGGAPRRLPDPAIEPGSRLGETLVAGNKLLIARLDTPGGLQVMKILSTVGDSTQTLRLPFSASYSMAFPDGKQFVSIGKTTGDSTWKLFLTPLNGSATRMLSGIPHDRMSLGGLLAPSRDGNLLAYTSHGQHRSKIFEIDFDPALRTIIRR